MASMRLDGWRITGIAAAILAIAYFAIPALGGFSSESVHTALRLSGRVSMMLFLAAFTASSFHGLFRTGWSAWLLRNRRYIGVSFAISHLYHFFFIASAAYGLSEPLLDNLLSARRIQGEVAYLFIAAMAATSFDASRDWLGRRAWTVLHTAGGYYLWFFFASGVVRSIDDPARIPFAIALGAAMLLRIVRSLQRATRKHEMA